MTVHVPSFSPAAGVAVSVLPAAARFSLRVREEDRSAVAAALGLPLPARIGAVAEAGPRRALCLGPDEWQIDTAEGDATAVEAALAGGSPVSLVDVSDREVTFRLEGPRAEELLTIGCPRNLSRVAPGTGMRTVFDSVQAVLVREAPDRFALAVWRSFAPHVAGLLAIGAAELAVGL